MALTFEETIFLLSFFVLLALFLFNLYVIMTKLTAQRNKEEESKHISWVFITYICSSLAFGFSLITNMVILDNTLMRMLFRFEIPLFILSTLFLIIQLIVNIQARTAGKTRGRYNPNETNLS